MIVDDANPIDQRVRTALYPYLSERLSVLQSGGRLVHYSSAEAAMSMITNREVWLRNTTCMNDFTEVDHGLTSLANAYRSPQGVEWQAWFDSNFDNVCKEAANVFDKWQGAFREGAYVACLSEHDASEDELGRLSMWRAYGGVSGVALVLNPQPFYAVTDALETYSSPVRYASTENLAADFEKMTAGLEQERDLLLSIGRDAMLGHLFNIFKWAALSIKHPGFHEEREWRIAHVPALATSPNVVSEVRSVRGMPQTVYKLPLRPFEKEGFSTAVPDILDRVIIGPTEFPSALRNAFIEILRQAGVANPSDRVFVSQIPLR
jgi:hypothetical protein